ncbi:arsenate-mycothiol transferase ArsC [Natronobiforma cellulositropha]|uniref:arsenate-mycothiol transferase ArsC n=1 Tax=Natronobiforma cellulositropha TaxID=1679076 RepID=UPI0021D5FC88|nr:low molecular weight phosphatase family protein [Natronobiforma cellulositropha]
MSDETQAATRVALMCVQNAGRSQMASAFAEREREARGLGERVDLVSGGTNPAEHVHEVVVDAMAERDIDLADRTPQRVTEAELAACDYVVTMGCSTLELDAESETEVRDWALADPHGEPLETVREIRDEVENRVTVLFDEIEASLDDS